MAVAVLQYPYRRMIETLWHPNVFSYGRRDIFFAKHFGEHLFLKNHKICIINNFLESNPFFLANLPVFEICENYLTTVGSHKTLVHNTHCSSSTLTALCAMTPWLVLMLVRQHAPRRLPVPCTAVHYCSRPQLLSPFPCLCCHHGYRSRRVYHRGRISSHPLLTPPLISLIH